MDRIEKLKKDVEGAVSEVRAAYDAKAAAEPAAKNLDVEARKAHDAKYDGAIAEAKAKATEARAAYDAEVELRKTEVAVAQQVPVVAQAESRGVLADFVEVRKTLAEKRAITINGTGAVAVVQGIVKALLNKTTLMSKFRYFYGPNGSTVIPILSPGIAAPAGQAEGATSVTADSTAVLATKNILPKAYVSVLAVSAEAILMSGSNIDAELPSLFADAFLQAMFAGSLTGDGTGNNMTGMFLGTALTQSVSCAAAGAPKLLDLAKLALTVQDYADDMMIVIHPTLISNMLAETTAESAPIKQEIMTSRTCMGVPIFITSKAPSATTAASIVAIAMPMSNYGVGIASELDIVPIRVKGDTNTYFQATWFFNGTTIVPANGWKLLAV